MPNKLKQKNDISYARPPVVETVLGVQFDRVPALSNSHWGIFWKTLDQHEWPNVEDAAPLPNQIERFTDAARWGAGLQIQLTDDPTSRYRIRNRLGDRMIQLQNTRLHLNWLGELGGEYPRYETMRTVNWTFRSCPRRLRRRQRQPARCNPSIDRQGRSPVLASLCDLAVLPSNDHASAGRRVARRVEHDPVARIPIPASPAGGATADVGEGGPTAGAV